MEGEGARPTYTFDDLPEEVASMVWDELCPTVKRTLSKGLYAQHHGSVVPAWRTQRYFSYIRFLIRNACAFPLRVMIARDGELWLRSARWQMSSTAPKTHYLHHLQYLCIEQKATRCREALAPLLHRLTEKRYRKVRGPHDRTWTN
jgi:hypothetical protein